MVLPATQLAGYAKAAGFAGNDLVIAVAVSLAESGGDATAHNTNVLTGDDSYGLMQINMLGKMGPERRKKFGLKSNADLYDPATNFRVAYAFYKSAGGFARDWSTYRSGAYLLHMPRAKEAAGNPDTSLPSTAGAGGTAQQTGLLDAGSAISDFFDFIANPATWLRLGMIVGGGILLGIALLQVSGVTGKAKQALNAAVDVVPGGKAVKAATAVAKVE